MPHDLETKYQELKESYDQLRDDYGKMCVERDMWNRKHDFMLKEKDKLRAKLQRVIMDLNRSGYMGN